MKVTRRNSGSGAYIASNASPLQWTSSMVLNPICTLESFEICLNTIWKFGNIFHVSK